MPDEPRPLHLHTLESLTANLVSGRPVLLASGQPFALQDERARSALQWYRKRGAAAWTANVSAASADDLVNAILVPPPQLPLQPVRPANANKRRIRLKKLVAHRFAGLHKFGTLDTAPPDYVHEFTSPITLFEGRNGSGKTSLLNAIIWALTGELLRPQREPEAPEDFECWVDTPDGNGDVSTHRLSPITPLPNVEDYRPDRGWVPADTWVELTFVDEDEAELPIIRRSVTRSPQGILKETPPDLTVLGLDPIGVRIGTIMPGLLPLIKLGSVSELGRAVSQLTGLSGLVDLADHVRRAKGKIDGDFAKARTAESDRADRDYITAKDDLQKLISSHASLTPPDGIPEPSSDTTIDQSLNELTRHFENAKAVAFDSARDILGERFDPTAPALLADLEKNIGRAFERVSQPQILASAARLSALRQLKPEQLTAADAKINEIIAEASKLDELARNPTEAARLRLYARVAAWLADHPDPERRDDVCPVCDSNIIGNVDPVTGRRRDGVAPS